MVDSALVSSAGEAAVSAVSLVDSLNLLFITVFAALGIGGSVVTAQYVGSRNYARASLSANQLFYAATAVATFFMVVLPMLKPTLISVAILETMWVWNDYLLPYLVLDRTKYMTIPIMVQYLKGSYGTVDLGATMAIIMMSIIPIISLYMFCQKHSIKGVAAGAVKG
jgi:raffinose/stachyose/melibiose transport system permease protein